MKHNAIKKRIWTAVALTVIAVAGGGIISLIQRDSGTADLAGKSSESIDTGSASVEPKSSSDASEISHSATVLAEQTESIHPSIFLEVNESELNDGVVSRFMKDRAIEKYRIVKVDADVIRQRVRDPDGELMLNLFSDFQVTAVPRHREEISDGPATGLATWIGRVKGVEQFSNVTLAVYSDNTVTGSVRGPFGVYLIGKLEQPSYQIIWKRDPSKPTRVD